jgi:hypothetical protein
MGEQSMSILVRKRLGDAAHALRVADPSQYVGGLLERTFWLPAGDPKYADNALSPGAVPCEPRFSEETPRVLNFTIEPLAPGTSPVSRRDEATREMRRLVSPNFGRGALAWFDSRSEEWRGFGSPGRLAYGAWFGSAFDEHGLRASTVYYELHPSQLGALPRPLAMLVKLAQDSVPTLRPVFTSITCSRGNGNQRVTFLHRGPLRLADLEPLMARLGLAHQLPAVMQVIGLTLGGRFDLPENSVLLGLRVGAEGPELELEVLLGAVPDVPSAFMELLALGLAERPRQLRELAQWLNAFTPESDEGPGDITVLKIRTTPTSPPRVSLHLRPIEFDIKNGLATSTQERRAVAVGAS